MGYLKYLFLVLAGIIFSASGFASQDKIGKVLVICSYGPDYQWSNSIVDSIGVVVHRFNPRVELNVEYISSEMFVESYAWVNKVNLLLDNYQTVKPLAIVLISDEAWMAYRGADTEAFAGVPLFLCAVKPHSIELEEYIGKKDSLTIENFHLTTDAMSKYNATGVLRQMNVPMYIELMNKTIPSIYKYALVTDSRFYGVYTRIIVEDYIKAENITRPVDYFDARFINTDSLLRALPHITPRTGVLLTSWLTGLVGFEYSKSYVYKEMASALKTPIFITNNIGLSTDNFIGGYLNDAGFWGEVVGKMVVLALGDVDMNCIPTKIFRDTQCQINWNVMHRFDIPVDVLPQDVIYVNRPESLLKKYRNEVVAVVVLLVLIAIVCAFIVKNNVKLKRAGDIAQRAINEANTINDSLVKTRNSLQVALARAEEADRLKSAFISNMDRELRTPLNTIVGFASIMSSMEDKKEIEEAVMHIEQNSQRLLEVVQSIIDLSKIESGQVELLCSNLNLTGVMLDIVTLYKTRLHRGVELIFTPSIVSVTLFSDAYRLTQVISALVDNAIKFTPKGAIEVGYLVEGDIVEIFVKDSGIGIAPEHFDYLFEHFYKCDPYQMGSGLGLSIAKKIVNILHGDIGMSSVVGEGSRFWVRFKIEQ